MVIVPGWSVRHRAIQWSIACLSVWQERRARMLRHGWDRVICGMVQCVHRFDVAPRSRGILGFSIENGGYIYGEAVRARHIQLHLSSWSEGFSSWNHQRSVSAGTGASACASWRKVDGGRQGEDASGGDGRGASAVQDSGLSRLERLSDVEGRRRVEFGHRANANLHP